METTSVWQTKRFICELYEKSSGNTAMLWIRMKDYGLFKYKLACFTFCIARYMLSSRVCDYHRSVFY